MKYVLYNILTKTGLSMIISVLHDQGGVSMVAIEVSPNSSESIDIIELIWKTMIGSLEWKLLLLILFLLYIALLLPITVNKLLKKLHIVNTIHWCLFTMYNKMYLQLILLWQDNIFVEYW